MIFYDDKWSADGETYDVCVGGGEGRVCYIQVKFFFFLFIVLIIIVVLGAQNETAAECTGRAYATKGGRLVLLNYFHNGSAGKIQ